MKVAIVNLTAGGMSGGYRKYLQKMLPLMQESLGNGNLCTFFPSQLNETVSFESILLDIRSWTLKGLVHKHGALHDLLRTYDPDVVFIPTGRWVDLGFPTVIMIRNMEPLVLPFKRGSFLASMKNLVRYYAARQASRRAQRVIAVSEYVSDFLEKRWHIEPKKIGIVYHGVEEAPDLASTQRPVALQDMRDEPFIFTAGSIRPARGLEDVIHALSLLPDDLSVLNLVIAGSVNPGTQHYYSKMERLSQNLNVASRIIWAGHLPAHEMSWCFLHSRAFVMSSRVEACPNTALEAMAHGAVCIAGQNPPMPEFFRDAALYYASGDGQSLAKALVQVLYAERPQRVHWTEQAMKRAAGFSWSITADKTIQELERALHE